MNTISGIRCAHCKSYHPSVSDVKLCASGYNAKKVFEDIEAPTKIQHTIPEGRYAVEINGTIKFFKIDKPTEGRWAGYTFVKVQHSDDYYYVTTIDMRRLVLEAIGEDPSGASALYGKHIGACGVCGRTLTNEVSRKAGIGPVCRERFGW